MRGRCDIVGGVSEAEEEEALLAAIAADVDSPEPRLVYADWLQQHGDPRGELAIAQHRYAQEPSESLRLRVSAMEAAVEAQVIAPLSHPDIVGGWWLGFVDQLTMHRRLFAIDAPAWLDRVPLRFVRTLNVAVSSPAAWKVVAGWAHRGHVQALRYGTTDKRAAVGNLRQAGQLLPGVRRLELASARVPDLGPLASLRLASLRLDVAELAHPDLDHVYASDWPLERFSLRVKYMGPLDVARERVPVLEAVLAGRALQGVRHLEIAGVPPVPIVERLVASGRIDTLDSLSLDFSDAHGERARLLELAPRLAHVRLEFPVTGHYSDRFRLHRLAQLLDEMEHPDAIDRYERMRYETHDIEQLGHYAGALHRRGDGQRIVAAIDHLKRTADFYYPLTDHAVTKFAYAVERLEPAGTATWHAMQLVVARACVLDRQFAAALERLEPLPADDSVQLLRALAFRELGDVARRDAALAPLAASRSAVHRALAALVADRFEGLVPSRCIEPRAIAAVIDPACGEDARLDCAEIAIYAAYRLGMRELAAARARALADELPREVRAWNHDLRAVFGVLPIVDSVSRAFVEALVRALRCRAARVELELLITRFLGSES